MTKKSVNKTRFFTVTESQVDRCPAEYTLLAIQVYALAPVGDPAKLGEIAAHAARHATQLYGVAGVYSESLTQEFDRGHLHTPRRPGDLVAQSAQILAAPLQAAVSPVGWQQGLQKRLELAAHRVVVVDVGVALGLSGLGGDVLAHIQVHAAPV